MSQKTLSKLLLSFACLMAFGLFACSDDNHEIPVKGEVIYEIKFSEDIVENTSFGQFLPRTVVGLYDSTSVRLTISAPLGMASANVVLSPKEDFVTFSVEDKNLILSMADILEADSALAFSESVRMDALPNVEVCGYMSHHVAFVPLTADSLDTRLDVFFVPFSDKGIVYDTGSFIQAKTNHQDVSFGLITAINVRIGDSAIMMIIDGVKSRPNLSADEFRRPEGYIATDRKSLEALFELLAESEFL